MNIDNKEIENNNIDDDDIIELIDLSEQWSLRFVDGLPVTTGVTNNMGLRLIDE